jgi:hypothetical protein
MVVGGSNPLSFGDTRSYVVLLYASNFIFLLAICNCLM